MNLFAFEVRRYWPTDRKQIWSLMPEEKKEQLDLVHLFTLWRKQIIFEWAECAADLKHSRVGVLSFDSEVTFRAEEGSYITFTGQVYLTASSVDDANILLRDDTPEGYRGTRSHPKSPFDKMVYRPKITRMLSCLEQLAEIEPVGD